MLPFNNDIIDLIDSRMPEYDAHFKKSWQEVTDQRAQDFKQFINQGKKITIFWSGGIDSTCIVVAFLKNFDRSYLEHVHIACSADGIVENPFFYHNHILPNFQVVEVNYFVDHVMKNSNHVVVEGYAADTLTMSMTPSLDVCMAMRRPDLLTQDWRKPDALIEYLAEVTGSREFAVWYYEKTRISVESVNVPIETYFDFLWWLGFNCEYYSWALHNWFLAYRHLNMSYEECKQKNIGWFRTKDYQLWSMANNGPMVKHGDTLGSMKKHVKKYIYDYDKNDFYFKYKTKINSAGRNYNRIDKNIKQKPFAITDSFQILYLDHDLDSIIDLLPTHIRT